MTKAATLSFRDDDRTLVDRRPPFAPASQREPSQPIELDQIAGWREARTAPLFDGLPNRTLRAALESGSLQLQLLSRDALVPLDGRLALILSGQVALGRFAPDILAKERQAAEALRRGDEKAAKRERKRRDEVGPLIRLAEQNLATFEEGDVVETTAAAAGHATLAAYATTPVRLAILDRACAEEWKRAHPFLAERLRRASASARARLSATDGARGMVADFFIRHGLSVSMTLRVRRIDACFECGACEQACEDRYGVSRLSLNGRILGGLDFVDACHTCTDARCIDPCNFDAISFDPQRREVLIKEEACTGCTLCARACPYDAIEMHELEDKPLLALRLEQAGALAFGDGKPRKARLRRMASKCDHCTFFEDQACISACPTGALLEVHPEDVVTHLPEQARAVAKTGFDRSVTIAVGTLNRVDAFTAGLDVPDLGRARAPRAQLMTNLWWAVGLIAVALATAEILLRRLWPQLSLAYLTETLVDGIDPEVARMHVDYRPGCELAVNLGYVGTALLLSGMAYVLRRRLSFLRNLGTLQAWFDWHVVSTVIGSLFILLHTALKLDNWISCAFWSMVGAVISGLLGRYLATQLPERASRAAIEALEADRALATLATETPGLRAFAPWIDASRRRISEIERRLGGPKAPPSWGRALRALAWALSDDLGRGRRLRRLRRALRRGAPGFGLRRARRETALAAERLVRLERRRALLPHLLPLFTWWKAVHVPMACLLTVIGSIHVALALMAGR